MNAFDILEFSKVDKENVFNLLYGILLLGNLEFEQVEKLGADGSSIKNTELLHYISSLFSLPAAELELWLTHKIFQPPKGEEIKLSLNVKLAEENRDALAKNLYDKLFAFIIEKINKSVNIGGNNQDNNCIGILDIFGFEIFEKNSFEQVIIII